MITNGLYKLNNNGLNFLKENDTQITRFSDASKVDSRPMFYSLSDKDNPEICYLIPMSTLRSQKQKDKIESFMKRSGISSRFYSIGKVLNQERAFKISSVFAVDSSMIDEWTIKNNIYQIQDQRLLNDISSKLNDVMNYYSAFPDKSENKVIQCSEKLKDKYLLKSFEKAYNEFIMAEEDLSNKKIVGILYTENLSDSYNFLDYQLQIEYDLKNKKEITNYGSMYASFAHKEDASLEQATKNLNVEFDDWLNSVPLNRDILSQYTALYCIGIDENTLNEKFKFNNLEINFSITNLEKDILISNISEKMKFDIEDTLNIPFDKIIKRYKTIEKSDREKLLLESVNEMEYKALINFSKSHYENLVVEGDKLLFIADIDDNSLEPKIYDSYKDCFMNEYKDKFINDFKILRPEEILKENNNDLLFRLALTDPNLEQVIKDFHEQNKDIDLDNDGISNRIDIDDNRNEVQTVDDMDKIEKSRTRSKKDKGLDL